MHIEAYPLTVDGAEQWPEIENFATVKNNLNFFYIGDNNGSLQRFLLSFESGVFAEDFIQARTNLKKLSNFPDVIFIDLPFHKLTEFQDFCLYLKERGSLSKTLIIYNEKKLDASTIKILKHLDLVDDVFDLDSQQINYSKKVLFLQKVKSQQNKFNSAQKQNKITATGSGRFLLNSAKRVFDITGSLTGILVLSPFFVLAALLVRFESKGPVMYISRRAGKGYKVFNFYKFRTMETDADQKIEVVKHLNQYAENENSGPSFLKICNDPRVTRVGKILRKTSLDELPQLFNVLKGDMSLVGNRPLPLYEASTLTTNECVERFMAPAGMTGLWQVKKRGKGEMSAEERISLDISYARKANIFYDFWIIAQTPTALFQKKDV
ncbi:MAG: sugar transferase [Chitinophagaceae bacterium]